MTEKQIMTEAEKHFMTASRTTDINIFRKTAAKLDGDALNRLIVHEGTIKAKAQSKVSLLRDFYLKGRMTEKSYGNLCSLYPNIIGIGNKVTEETKTGKIREMHVNPNAVKKQSVDVDFQLLKVLHASTMPEKLKNELIEAEALCKFLYKEAVLMGSKSNATEADKKQSIKNYEDAKVALDNVIAKVEHATGIITLSRQSAEKLLEIVEYDLNGRILKNQSVVNDKVARIKWIQGIQAFRARDKVAVEFLNICKELGIADMIPLTPMLHKKPIKALKYGGKSLQGIKEREKIAAEAKRVKEAKVKSAKSIAAEPPQIPIKA